VLGDACAILFILCLLTSGVTWIMGSDRALAVSCYDGAGPRVLGVINAKYGTPIRVNVFSGIVATIVIVLAHQISSGDAAQPPGHAPAVQDALLPATDRDPDGPGGHRQHPAHRPGAGQLVVRQ
jgi:Amino acid permease